MTNFLTDDDLKAIEGHAQIVRYQANESILTEHHENTGVYWVRAGVVRVELNRLYKNIVIAGISKGEMFGEMSFLMDDHKTSTTVVAHQEVEVMFIERDMLEKILDENHGLAARFYKTAAITLADRLKSQTHNS